MSYVFRISFDEVLNENAAFDPEEIYHTKTLEDHEGLMEYLNSVVPTETTHNLMRVSEANHWNKNTIKGDQYSSSILFMYIVQYFLSLIF